MRLSGGLHGDIAREECRHARDDGREAPRADECRAVRPRRRDRAGRPDRRAAEDGGPRPRPQRPYPASRPDQLSPPSRPDSDAQSARRAEHQPLSLAQGALPHLGQPDAGGYARRGAGRLRRARLSGCTTVFDHAYVFQNGCKVDDQIAAAAEIGVRFVVSRGSMSLGQSKGGLPPIASNPKHRSSRTAPASSSAITTPRRDRCCSSCWRPARPFRSPPT